MTNEIDLPSLQSIELGYQSFRRSLTTIIESMILIRNELTSSSFITIYQTRISVTTWSR